jgi:hypothetical protein
MNSYRNEPPQIVKAKVKLNQKCLIYSTRTSLRQKSQTMTGSKTSMIPTILITISLATMLGFLEGRKEGQIAVSLPRRPAASNKSLAKRNRMLRHNSGVKPWLPKTLSIALKSFKLSWLRSLSVSIIVKLRFNCAPFVAQRSETILNLATKVLQSVEQMRDS